MTRAATAVRRSRLPFIAATKDAKGKSERPMANAIRERLRATRRRRTAAYPKPFGTPEDQCATYQEIPTRANKPKTLAPKIDEDPGPSTSKEIAYKTLAPHTAMLSDVENLQVVLGFAGSEQRSISPRNIRSTARFCSPEMNGRCQANESTAQAKKITKGYRTGQSRRSSRRRVRSGDQHQITQASVAIAPKPHLPTKSLRPLIITTPAANAPIAGEGSSVTF